MRAFKCSLTDEGLEQPIANWAKLRETARRFWEERFSWLLGGHSLLRTDLRAPGIYGTIDCPQSRSSKLATTRFPVCKLATARLFCSHPLPLIAPSLSTWDLSVATIPSNKDSDIPPTPPPGEHGKRLIDGMDYVDGFGFLFLSTDWAFILKYWLLSQCIWWALENWGEVCGHVQGSEWSAEDWTGLASQVESQV